MAIDWLTLLCFYISVASALALEIPIHNCSHFTYRQLPSGEWIGLFQAPKAGILQFDWKASFVTQRQSKYWFLKHFPSEEDNLANIRNGGRARVFLPLEEFENRLPSLHVLVLNDEVICRNLQFESSKSFDFALMSYEVQEPMPTTVPDEPQETTQKSFFPFAYETQKSNATISVSSQPETKPRIRTDFEECGQEGFVATQHGGGLVTRGQYPWMAVLLEGGSSVTYKCVVSVISKRTVITAAHCIYGKSASQLWVYLGRHDRNQNPEDGAELVSVSNVLTPPEYNGNPRPDSDVGLLVLKHRIWYTRYIRPLCLWSSEMHVPAREGDTGTVAGWGYDDSGLKTRFPKAVSVRLVPRDQCLRKMKGVQDFITERTVCAGNSQSHGPCFGDSGAALIVLRNNRWVVRGIVSISPSRGDNCDLSNYVIYCDVSTHLDWIQQNTVM